MGFRAQHEALLLATQAPPEQVTALGAIRQSLGVRQVPAEAFANVGASALAGACHAGNIADTATMLAASAGWLRGINETVYGSRQAVEQWDRQQAVDELRRIAAREPISVAPVRSPELGLHIRQSPPVGPGQHRRRVDVRGLAFRDPHLVPRELARRLPAGRPSPHPRPAGPEVIA